MDSSVTLGVVGKVPRADVDEGAFGSNHREQIVYGDDFGHYLVERSPDS